MGKQDLSCRFLLNSPSPHSLPKWQSLPHPQRILCRRRGFHKFFVLALWHSLARQLTVAAVTPSPSVFWEPLQMNRRDLLRTAGATALALSAWPLQLHGDNPKKKRKLLVYTRSAGFEHSVVKLGADGTCLVDRIFTKLGAQHGFDVHCTKDGRIFLAESLKQFDAIFFETTEDLTKEGGDKQPPMPKEGKQALLDFVASGKGFVGSHCASDTFHSPGHHNGDFRHQEKV